MKLSLGRHYVVRGACALIGWFVVSAAFAAAPTITPGSWTLAILPDTQKYSRYYPAIFTAQTQFLADNKTALNLAYVLHEGDIVDRAQTSTQWINASNAMQVLDTAGIGYSLAAGNHDIGANDSEGSSNRTTLMPSYFPVSRLAAQPTFGGVYPGEPTNPQNSYSLFSAGGTDWLAIATEFGPRNQIVDWIDSVLKAYPDRKAMIVTHSYTYTDGSRYDWATKGMTQDWNPHWYPIATQPGGVNDGQEMWDKLKDNANLQFVFSGHMLEDGTGYQEATADHGNVVHEILANYQFLTPNYGNGYLRLLEFLPDNQTVHVRTYSPYLDASLTTPDQDFVFTMKQVPEPSTLFLAPCGILLLGLFASRALSVFRR